MANKTTVNTKPQDQTAKAAIQLQLARIKKEEEEELWISGEELYTEGSSDEEECKTQMRSRRRANNNHSSRASSANPCDDRRGRSPVYNQVRAKSENPSDLDNTIGEGRFKSENMPKISPLSVKSSSSSTTESERTHGSSKNEVKVSNIVNSISNDLIDVANFPMDKVKVENTEISWKANRESSSVNFDKAMVALKELRLKCGQSCGLETQLLDLDTSINDEKIHEHVIQDDIDISSENTEDEVMRNEILMIRNLDDTIREFNDKMKKSTEETLFCQYENRKRLSNILLSSSPETGRLAENTKEFFQLCPRYMMLIAETNKYSNASKGNSRKLTQQDKLLDFNTKLPSIMEEEKFTSYSEVVSNKTKNSESNPYTLDIEMKKILSELEESACGLWQNLHSVNDHVSSKSTEISQLDTVSTIKSLKDIDIEVVNEILKEAQITTPLSILTEVANDL